MTVHRVWALILSATVTLDDTEAPTVGAPTGDLADGAWHRGAGTLSFTASDNTGIRVRRLVEGSTTRATRTAPGAASAGCGDLNIGDAYTYVQPCAGARGLNGDQSISVPDVCAWGDGSHVIQAAAVDTGGLETTSAAGATVRADCSPPTVTVGPAQEGQKVVGGLVAPTVSAADARVAVASTETQVQIGTQGWQTYTGPIAAAAGSSYRFRARATDALGNTSAWSAPSAYTHAVWASDPDLPATPITTPKIERTAEPQPSTTSTPVGDTPATPPASGLVRLPLDPRQAAQPKQPSIRVTRTRRRGRTLRVEGRATGAATGTVRLRIALPATTPRRARVLIRRTKLRAGRFATTLTLPRDAGRAARVSATLTATG